MNRRQFGRTLAGTALAAPTLAALPVHAESALPEGEAPRVPFKISVMLWTVFEKLPFEERLEKVAEAGYHAVELVGSEYKNWSEEDFRRANRKRRELGITFDVTAGLAHGVGDPKAREAFLSDLRQALPAMDKIECRAIIVMSGDVVPGLSRAAQHQSCIEGLKRAAEIAEEKGITILLENIDLEENSRYYLWSAAEGFEIISRVGHPRVKFLDDFFHEQISEGNLIEKLEKNIDKLGLVHVADVPGRHEPGTGEINYANIYKKLAMLKYDRYVAMEFIPTGDPVESLRRAREEALRAASG
ncbi:MAG TPA: TIM barrel protein [Terriglobia bacterium]|nr:TIM barrel protein [Terriglobia bacterium]